jgi:hypothetical protein
MNRVYSLMALFFVALILTSLWNGLAGMHAGKNATAVGLTTGLSK